MSAKAVLLDLLDEAWNTTSWHGPNLKTALRGVTPGAAAWRPGPGRHSIRELALHAAFWKYRIRRRLTGELDATFALPGKDWIAPVPTRTWKQDLTLLADEHAALRAAVLAFPQARLQKPILPNGTTAAYLVRGIAAHDLYHAGQIALLKRMVKSR